MDSTCNEHGIKILEFTKPTGPIYHYEEATNVTFGDQPHLRDPLDKKYVYLKDSSEAHGEGTFASRDVPADIIYVLYGGYVYNKEETKILKDRINQKAKKHNWKKDDPDFEYVARYIKKCSNIVSPQSSSIADRKSCSLRAHAGIINSTLDALDLI